MIDESKPTLGAVRIKEAGCAYPRERQLYGGTYRRWVPGNTGPLDGFEREDWWIPIEEWPSHEA